MWSVGKPVFDVGDTFDTCISKIKSKDLKSVFQNHLVRALKQMMAQARMVRAR